MIGHYAIISKDADNGSLFVSAHISYLEALEKAKELIITYPKREIALYTCSGQCSLEIKVQSEPVKR